MLFIKLFIVAYFVAAVLTFFMVIAAVNNRAFRIAFVVLGFAMPLIFIYATVASLFWPEPMPRFNEEMGNVEDEIETERVRIFGGERTSPSFSDRWRTTYQAYLEKVVETAATASEKVVSLGKVFHNHHGHGSRAA